MKRFLISLAILLLGLGLASPVRAKVIVQEKGTVNIPAAEVINDDLFIGAESADIAGTVNGDIYIGAGTVNFSGRVSGDLVIGAGTVTIDKAVIGDSLILGAGTVSIDDQTKIGGSLLAGSGTFNNQAPVVRNFMVGAGNVKLNAPVGGEARIGAGNLALGPKTIIGGDLTYGAKQFDQDPAAVIKGEVNKKEMVEPKRINRPEMKQDLGKVLFAAKMGFSLVSFFGSLIVGLVLLWLIKKPTEAITDKIVTKFGASLGWGLVILCVAPFALLLLAITIVGLPLTFILCTFFILGLFLAKIFTSFALGKILVKNFGWDKMSLGLTLFLGLSVYYLLNLIPFLGFFVHLVAVLAGLGGVWLCKKKLLA